MTYRWPTVEEALSILGLDITPDEFRAAFTVQAPHLISFSGGRTSAVMLWCFLVVYQGKLPEGVIVAFANTGKEREETLRFVHEVGQRWNVYIHWVEWRAGRAPGFEQVSFNSASRKGEPFDALIEQKQFLPNPLTRYCTTKLKVETMKKLMLSVGFKKWSNSVGLRFDEGSRVLKQLRRNELGKERFTTQSPLALAYIREPVVMAFWWGLGARNFDTRLSPQGFDLELRPHEGNCDLCMLKGRGRLMEIIKDDPSRADWWINHEAKRRAPFRKYGEGRFEELKREALAHQDLFADYDADDEADAECGDVCEGDQEPLAKIVLQREFERVMAERRAAAVS